MSDIEAQAAAMRIALMHLLDAWHKQHNEFPVEDGCSEDLCLRSLQALELDAGQELRRRATRASIWLEFTHHFQKEVEELKTFIAWAAFTGPADPDETSLEGKALRAIQEKAKAILKGTP